MAFKKVVAKNKQGYKWECVKDGPPDPATGKRSQIRRRADTKREAEENVNEVIDNLKGGYASKSARITFKAASEDWYNTYKRSKVKNNTLRLRRVLLRIIYKYYGNALIDKITHGLHQKMLNDMEDDGYARSTIISAHSTANMVFKHAMRNKLRTDNPASGSVIPTATMTVEDIENSSIESEYLNRQEIHELLDAAHYHGLEGDFVKMFLLIFTGMRPGEMCAIKKTDLLETTYEISITKTIYHETTNMRNYELTPPKTDAGIRIFTIDEIVMNTVQEYIQTWKQYDVLNPPEHNGNFVFRHANGWPFNPEHIRRRLQRLLKYTTITKEFTPYIFRHTYVSMLAEAGVDLQTIMQRVGHDDAKTTLGVYTHVTKVMQKNADAKIRVAFKDILDLADLNKPDLQDL